MRLAGKIARVSCSPSSRRASSVPGLTAFGVLAGLALDQGGYFPGAWGWSAITLLWLAAMALLLRDVLELGVLEYGTLAALAALTAWTALSIGWSASPSDSFHEVEIGRASCRERV